MSTNDRNLLQALHKGEQYACDDLVERYAGQVYGVALRLTGHPNEAEEILQETFIKACRAVKDFEGRARLNTWLYRIATNNSLMRLRKSTPPTVSLDTNPENLERPFTPTVIEDWRFDPEKALLSSELQQVMQEGIRSLSESLRPAFVLRDLEGLSTQEAADILDISESALKVRLHRARVQLREHLADYFASQPVEDQKTA